MSRDEIDLMRLYNRVLNTYGIVSQTFMLVEECAELLNAVAKQRRDRANKEDIITELADVSIMVEHIRCWIDSLFRRIDNMEKIKISEYCADIILPSKANDRQTGEIRITIKIKKT